MVWRIIKGFLLIIFGMILGIVGLAGGLYYVATNVPVGQVESYIPGEHEIFGESVKDMSVLKLVEYVANEERTVGEIEDVSHYVSDAIDKIVENETLTAFISIDRTALRSLKLANISDIKDVIEVTATINSLADFFGFDLGDIQNYSPFKTTTVDVAAPFIEITGAADPNYDAEKTVYGYNEGEALLDKTTVSATGYTKLYQLKDVKDYDLPYLCYKEGDVYKACLDTENRDSMKVINLTGPFYVHKESIGDIPVTDAFSKFSDRIYDITVSEFLQGDEAEGIVSALKDLTLRQLSEGEYQDELDNVALADIFKNDTDNKVLNAIMYFDDSSRVTIGTLDERIDELKLKDVLDIDEGSPYFIKSLQNELIADFANVDIKLSNVFDMTDPGTASIIKALQYKRNADGSDYLDDYNNKVENGIEDLADQIYYLKLDEVIDCSGSNVLSVLADKNVTINDLADAINDIELSEICEHQVFSEVQLAAFNGTYVLYGYKESTGTYSIVTDYTAGVYVLKDGVNASSYDGFYKISNTAGAWTFISFNSSNTFDGQGNALSYSVNHVTIANMDTTLNSVANSLSTATIKQLVDVGILEPGTNPVLYPMTLANALALI